MFADEIRRQAEGAPRAALPAISAALWKAFAAGSVTEAEAEALAVLIEARKQLPAPVAAPLYRRGSRPRTDASMQRRRRWAASGRMPPGIACQFTLAEAAVLAVIASEVAKRGDCRLCLDHIAAVAGVSRSSAKAAIRQARKLGLVTVEERRASAWRSLSNIVRIVSAAWVSWLRLARPGGGVKTSPSTNTQGPRKGFRGEQGASQSAKHGPGSTQRPQDGRRGSGGGIA